MNKVMNYKYYIIAYFFICLCYGLYFYIKNREKGFIRFIITFFFPVFGFIFLIIMDVSMRAKKQEHDFDFIQESDKKYNIYDYKRNKDIIPVEEALLINDNKIKRELVIDVVKDNSISNVNVLKKALKDEDTETSHYAASAIMQIKSDFENRLREVSVEYENKKNDIETIKNYIATLTDYLSSDLMEYTTKKRLMNQYSELLGSIIELGSREKEYYIMKINIDLEREDFFMARRFCDEFLEQYKDSEEVYLLYMKLSYKLKDFNMLNEKLEELRSLPISLSNEALEKIRFWMGLK